MSSLPLVTREVAEGVMSEARSNKGYAEATFEQIAAENLLIAALISPRGKTGYETPTRYETPTLAVIVMYDMLRRSGNLPKVSEATLHDIGNMLSKQEGKEPEEGHNYLLELSTRMQRENPVLAEYVGTFGLVAGRPIETLKTLYPCAIAYRALEIEAARTGNA